MTNAELLAKIKAEIERLRDENRKIKFHTNERYCSGYDDAFYDLVPFIDTLESEKPMEQEGFEEEIIKCWQEWVSPSNEQSVEGVLLLSEFAFYARHFAQWGAEQFEQNRLAACDKQTKEEYDREVKFATSIIEKEHRQPTFSDAINYGMKLQKEQMMKEAMEGLICATITGTNAISFLSPLPKELTAGDKVKLIICKED